LASAVMGAVVWFLSARLEPLQLPRLLGWILKVFVPVTLGAASYFFMARALKLPEASALIRRRR